MTERLAASLVSVFLEILQKLPVGVVYRLGRFGGMIACLVLPRYRRLVRSNLSRALGKSRAETNRLASAHFRALGANLLCAARFMGADEQTVRRHTDMVSLEILLEAHARGRGVVLAISHIGNWELFAQAAFYARGIPFGTVFQKVHNRGINELIDRKRRRLGVKTFDRSRELAAAAQFLKDGGVLGVLVDQHAGDSGVWTPLFGSLASTSPLAASLATRTGAAVVPVDIATSGFARWKIEVRPEVRVDSSDPDALTAAINRALEKQICESPADWFWVHNRWKLPLPNFLLGSTKRGFYYPPDMPPDSLQKVRVVVRTSNWLGDAVMNVPAVRAIKGGRPDVHLAVFCPENLRGLWEEVPEVDEVITFPKKAAVFKSAQLLRSGGFHAAVLFPNSFRTAFEAWLAGIPRRVGYAGHWRRKLLDQIIKPPRAAGPPVHQVHHYLRIVEKCGAPAPLTYFPPPKTIVPEGGLRRIAVCPGAEYGSAKRWPVERFKQTMELVAAKLPEIQWTLVGIGKDAPLTAPLAEAFPASARDLAGKTTLSQLVGELRACDLLLTNDTGTMHLAAFLGIPVVAVFGSTEPRLTGPLPSNPREPAPHIVLRHQVECSPCFLRECPLDFRCMNSISAGHAAEAVLKLLESGRNPSAAASIQPPGEVTE